MVCAGARAISVLKFVGTVSLGLLTVRLPPSRVFVGRVQGPARHGSSSVRRAP